MINLIGKACAPSKNATVKALEIIFAWFFKLLIGIVRGAVSVAVM